MKTHRSGALRRPGILAALALALALVGASQAQAASPDRIPGKVAPGAPKPGVQGKAPRNDSFAALRSQIGAQGMKNQEELNAYKTWLVTRPGIHEKGFYDSAVDIASRTMTLQWHGDSKLLTQAVAEGKRRGLNVVVKRVSYTQASVQKAMKALLDPKNAAKLGGFKVYSVAGPTVANDRLTVSGSTAGAVTASAAAVRAATPALSTSVKSLTGMDASFEAGAKSEPFATRSSDFSPYNAGGMIRGSNGSGCTSGFAILRSGFTWTTTDRHCTDPSWTAWDAPANSYGSSWDSDPGTGLRMLTGDGFYWMFDGAWNNPNGWFKTVWGLADVSQGSTICGGGANSGMHCNLVVDNMAESFNDGFGTFTTIRVHALSGIVGAHGDSGGPMMIPSSDGLHVWAVGMLMGTNEAQTSNCGSLRIPTTCASYVEFSPERRFLTDMGATLYTSS
jgi:hypothetical protein